MVSIKQSAAVITIYLSVVFMASYAGGVFTVYGKKFNVGDCIQLKSVNELERWQSKDLYPVSEVVEVGKSHYRINEHLSVGDVITDEPFSFEKIFMKVHCPASSEKKIFRTHVIKKL